MNDNNSQLSHHVQQENMSKLEFEKMKNMAYSKLMNRIRSYDFSRPELQNIEIVTHKRQIWNMFLF